MTPTSSPALFEPPFQHVCALWMPADLEALEARARRERLPVPERLASAVPKRRAEFLAGRLCASAALRQCGCQEFVEVPGGDARAPVWPAGFVGSITHTLGFAAAVVVARERAQGVGLDVERIMAPATYERIGAMILTAREREALTPAAANRGWQREALATLIFSAKESLYKCLHPLTGVYLGFQDVEAEIPDPAGSEMTLTLLCAAGMFPSGQAFPVRWVCDPPWVHTGIALSAGGTASPGAEGR